MTLNSQSASAVDPCWHPAHKSRTDIDPTIPLNCIEGNSDTSVHHTGIAPPWSYLPAQGLNVRSRRHYDRDQFESIGACGLNRKISMLSNPHWTCDDNAPEIRRIETSIFSSTPTRKWKAKAPADASRMLMKKGRFPLGAWSSLLRGCMISRECKETQSCAGTLLTAQWCCRES